MISEELIEKAEEEESGDDVRPYDRCSQTVIASEAKQSMNLHSLPAERTSRIASPALAT